MWTCMFCERFHSASSLQIVFTSNQILNKLFHSVVHKKSTYVCALLLNIHIHFVWQAKHFLEQRS